MDRINYDKPRQEINYDKPTEEEINITYNPTQEIGYDKPTQEIGYDKPTQEINYDEEKIGYDNPTQEINYNKQEINNNNIIPNAYFESEIDSSNNVTKLNFINDINSTIKTPNDFLINNYKNFLNSKGIFIIKININKLEDYIIKHLKIQMIDIKEINNKDIKDIKGSSNYIDELERKQELMKNYDNNDVYNFFAINKNNLINTSIKIIKLSSVFGFYTIMKENSIQTSPPTSITIIIPKILFENNTDFLNFLFDNYIPSFIPPSFVTDRINIYKKNIKNIFNGFNNGFNNASNKEIKIINTINIILNIIMKIFIIRVFSDNYSRQNYSDSIIDSYSNFLAELANEFVSIIPDTQCYFNQDNYLEFNPGICTSKKYPQQTCPVQTCPKNNTILYVGIIGGIIVLLIIIVIIISMQGNKDEAVDSVGSDDSDDN